MITCEMRWRDNGDLVAFYTKDGIDYKAVMTRFKLGIMVDKSCPVKLVCERIRPNRKPCVESMLSEFYDITGETISAKS